LRIRSLIGALSTELFGIPLSLLDFPRVKSLRGLGTSHSVEYTDQLAAAFDYRNTFFDRDPRFDLGNSAGEPNTYDFVVSGDVFEHVAPPSTTQRNISRNCTNMPWRKSAIVLCW
jgi:hypothetical protein